MAETLLAVDSLVKHFGAVAASDDFSMAVARGELHALIGPNGAGKTTALRLLLGFARPSSGEVRLFGQDPRSSAARHGLGYLPERLVLPNRMRVQGLLRLHAKLAGLTGAERDRSVDEVMAQVGIADRARDRIGALSNGLRQRVGFAQAFLGPPRMLLLDEPTSGLDPIGIRDARDWIEQARERGCSILVSSHVLSEVERLCDRVAILHEGRIAAVGALDEIVEPDESLEDAFVRLVRGS